MGSREAKIIGYMHMYKRNHMEGENNIVLTCGFYLGSKLFTLLRRG